MPTDTPDNATPESGDAPKPLQIDLYRLMGLHRPSKAEMDAKLQKMMEEQGKVGKARIENILEAGKDFFDSPEEHEEFIELLRKIREQP